MLIETAVTNAQGALAKKQIGLDEIRSHDPDPITGRSLLTLKSGSQFAASGPIKTWEAFTVLSARLETLSEAHPVALMDADDWQAAMAAHGG